jgi:hypothetical protein
VPAREAQFLDLGQVLKTPFKIIHEASTALRPEGALGVRQLAAAFKNSSIFKDSAKSASLLAHSESVAYKC